MKTMTLNLTVHEMDALNALSEQKGMSKTAVMKAALKMYQMIEKKLETGGRVYFQSEQDRALLEVLIS